MNSEEYKRAIERGYHRNLGVEADAPRMEAAAGSRVFMNRVYNWMFCGLGVSALAAWILATNESLLKQVIPAMWGLIVVELILVVAISAAINKISATAAGGLFLGYALLNGITLAPIFYVYAHSTIALAFVSAAAMFAATSVYGYATKKDLASVGSFCFMALIGVIVATLVNLFLKSAMLDYVLSYLGVAIFVGLTAWDTQKLRVMSEQLGESAQSDGVRKIAILGALTLYLDFINMFLFLLRIFGDRK